MRALHSSISNWLSSFQTRARHCRGSSTEPSSMYLDIYFNALPIHALDGTQKQKPTNSLVPTTIAYPGGLLDFQVRMEPEFATRLMIIRGGFVSLTIAVHGVQVQPSSQTTFHYEPRILPHVESSPLSLDLDPSKNIDPTVLAKRLLKLIPDAPDLLLVTRLMFCLKPQNEDWDDPKFPHLYSDVKQDFLDWNLERAVKLVTRPVADTEDPETIKEFALRVADCIVSNDDDEAYLVAKILSHSASQTSFLAQSLVANLDLGSLFIEANLDRPTLLYLLDASANLDIARQLKISGLTDTLDSFRNALSQNAETRWIAGRLWDRLMGWEVLEDALSNTQSSFTTAARLIKDIALEETSFGIFLSSMLSHPDVLDRLSDNTVTPHLLPHPVCLWNGLPATSHEDFIAFIRAFIGVASVLAVYAWSDSVPIDKCKERSLLILRHWQGVEGYREIVNHLLLMRQMVYRLQYMLPTENDLPSRPNLDAEHILKNLAMEPLSMQRKDFREVMHDLPSPLNFITNDEILVFQRAAAIVSDGLVGAVKVVVHDSGTVGDWDYRLYLRIALATLIDGIQKPSSNTDQVILSAVWMEGQSNLIPCLVDHLMKVGIIISGCFRLTLPPRTPQKEVASMFEICGELLSALMATLSTQLITHRDVKLLVCSMADIFVCTDSADTSYSQGSEACVAAHAVRQEVIDMASHLVLSLDGSNSRTSRAILVLRTLLDHAFSPSDHDAGHHMTQVFWLFDHALPSRQTERQEDKWTDWMNAVIPCIVPQLRKFYSKQEGENRSHLIRRFLDIDRERLGVAEWLLAEEQRLLYDTIRSARRSASDTGLRAVYQARVGMSLQVLMSLVQSSSESTSFWTIRMLLNDEEGAAAMEKNLYALLVQNLFYESMGVLASLLARHCEGVTSRLRTAVSVILFRAARSRIRGTFTHVPEVLEHGIDIFSDQILLREFGGALDSFCDSVKASNFIDAETAEAVIQILVKLAEHNGPYALVTIPALSSASLSTLTTWLVLNEDVSEQSRDALQAVKGRLSAVEYQLPSPTVISSENSLTLPFESWHDMISPAVPVPSTPKRKSPAQSAELAGMVTVSPSNALLRSPEVKGLTKTYTNNDFRQLRQLTSARQNTSRLPSMHVDDFEQGTNLNIVAPLNLASPITATFPTPPRPASLPSNPMTLMPNYNNFSQGQ